MSIEKKTPVTIQNISWVGKYTLCCDIILSGRHIQGISANASPPFKDAEVYLPYNHDLTEDEQGQIAGAVLAYYYDIDDDCYCVDEGRIAH